MNVPFLYWDAPRTIRTQGLPILGIVQYPQNITGKVYSVSITFKLSVTFCLLYLGYKYISIGNKVGCYGCIYLIHIL